MKTVLIIAAHPDDEVLGCGGTMARLAAEGNSVHSIILGEGITSRDEERDRKKREQEIQVLKRQVDTIGGMLGVKKNFLFDFPDNRFDSVDLLDIVKVIEGVKADIEPDMIYTHFYGDLNIDHRITFEAVMTAFRPLSGEKCSDIYAFEVPSSTEWAFGRIAGMFSPNRFIDINAHMAPKIKAIEMYEGEVREFPHPRSAEAIRVQARRWGSVVGLEHAEAFELIRSISK